MTDGQIVEAMVLYGGSFVAMLGKTWLLGDKQNRARLKMVFPEYWEQYEELAKLFEERKAKA